MTKIINITEEEIYRIVKKVLISEQNQFGDLYIIKGNNKNAHFITKNGYLSGVYYDYNTKKISPVADLNGKIDEFKVQVLKTGQKDTKGYPKFGGQILDQRFIDNNQSMKVGAAGETKDDKGFWGIPGGYLSQLMRGFKPSQTKSTYGFFGITPEGQPGAGLPRAYTADIYVGTLLEMDAMKRTETTEKNVISPTTYQRLGKFGKKKNLGVTIKLYGAPNPAEIYVPYEEPLIPTRITISTTLTDPFEFDQTVLYPESEDSIQEFIDKIQGHLNNPQYGERFKRFLSQNQIQVLAYASIDADSKDISQGRLPECQNPNQTKEEYNLCLSRARANFIKDKLESSLEDVSVIARGEGETDKFAPGKKWPQVKNPKETKPNRAVQIIVPEFSTNID